MGSTVPAIGIRALLRALQRLNLDTDALLTAAGLSPDMLLEPDARVDAGKADALWALAYRQSGDEHLAIRAAQQLKANDYRSLSYLAAYSRTLGEGIQRLVRWFDLIDRRLRWSIDASGDPVFLSLSIEGVPHPLPRPPVEYTLGAMMVTLRATLELDWRPLRIDVGFARPDDDTAVLHEELFGSRVAYGAHDTRVLIQKFWWNHAIPRADASLADMLEELASRRVRELPDDDDLKARLHRVLGSSLQGGPPTIEAVARELGVSARSLQRHLQVEGSSFRAELAAVRRAHAKLLLADPMMALAEVSWLLGFSDPRAFTRAFRRWHGVPPSIWRQGRGR